MDELVLPPGFKYGCLPRATQFGTCCKPMADEIEEIPRDQWQGLIGTVNLRPRVRQVFDQGSNGSCATESTTQGVMIAREVSGLPFELLNPLSIYHFTNGGSDNGSNIDSNLVRAREVGILPESYWPRSKGWRPSPPVGYQEVAKQYRIKEFFDIASIGEVGTALLKGFGVVFGWSGHSCILTDLLSPTEALYCNSWSKEWGDVGFGKIKLASINFGYGLFAIRSVVPTGA